MEEGITLKGRGDLQDADVEDENARGEHTRDWYR